MSDSRRDGNRLPQSMKDLIVSLLDRAIGRARAAGMTVVIDRCPAIEYGRLF